MLLFLNNNIYVLLLTVEIYYFADGRCYSNNHGMLDTIDVSMTIRFQRSASLSVRFLTVGL